MNKLRTKQLLNWAQSAHTSGMLDSTERLCEKKSKSLPNAVQKHEILTTASRHLEVGIYQISAPNSKVCLPEMSDMPTGHAWYARADFGKNRFQDQNSTKPTRIDLQLCRRNQPVVGRLPPKDHGLRQIKTPWIKEKWCKSKFSPQNEISPDLWAHVESEDFLWWNTSTHVLTHLETTGTT